MRKFNLLVSLLMLATTGLFATNQNYDWIQMTQFIQYTVDGNEYARMVYTYDSEGRESGHQYYINGELYYQYRDYQYNGRTITCWNDTYSGGSVNSSYKIQRTYSDINWIQMTQFIQYTLDGNEYARMVYTYDTEGRESGHQYYINGALYYQYRDYQYNGRTITCWNDTYSEGNVSSSYKIQRTYSDKNWIQMTQFIQYSGDDNEYVRMVYTYDALGRESGHQYFINGVLYYQYRDYQYNGRTITCWNDTYSEGNVNSSYKIQRTYKEATSTSVTIDLVDNSITIYPNPIKDEFKIKNYVLNIENVEIYNINGKMILSSTKPTINISHFLAGVYFVKIRTDKGVLTKKIIKK
jgi:hypothetical protein